MLSLPRKCHYSFFPSASIRPRGFLARETRMHKLQFRFRFDVRLKNAIVNVALTGLRRIGHFSNLRRTIASFFFFKNIGHF